ncbi:MAG: hypothetical protein ACW97G_14900 [Candidatus Thorarchaeota archaeon]|jgi:hypothetical protein
MTLHNRNPLLLCLGGGALLIISGASGAIGLINELAEGLAQIFGLTFVLTFENIMAGLAILTIFGGLVAILGGVILTTARVRLGRIVILLSITIGVIGLLMTLVQMASAGVFVMDMTQQLQQSVGWIGAIMAFIARTIAEQKPMVDR